MTTLKNGKKVPSSYGRLGILLIGIGAILAIDSFTDRSIMYKLWPLLCTMSGIGFIGIYQQRSRREASYISIGTFFILFSFLALYCNFTSWGVLSTLWPIFIGMFGISMIVGFMFGNRSPILLLSSLLFISLATVFFLVFSIKHQLWWSIFILAGCSFFIFDKARRSR
jgi:hypothetical protein